MTLKLKSLAAAVGLVASMSASAAFTPALTDPSSGNGQLIFNAWLPNGTGYTQNLGLTLDGFLASIGAVFTGGTAPTDVSINEGSLLSFNLSSLFGTTFAGNCRLSEGRDPWFLRTIPPVPARTAAV